MSEPLVAHGNGTCDVMMLNSGNLPQTIKADWIETHEDDPVVLPILVFVIKHGGKYYLWDLGTRGDFSTSFDPSILARFKRSAPVIHRRLPANLPADCKPLSAVFISHYHWDHCGNPALLPKDVAVWVGRGTLEAIDDGRLGSHAGPAPHEVRERLWEIPEGNVSVLGYEQKGWDVFGDGSFVMLPAPGHCPGHCIAIARVRKDPDAYIVLGSDSGHARALYEPCPCHHRTAEFGRLQLHSDLAETKRNLARLAKIHARDDSWIIVAHEREAVQVVPQETWLGDWQEAGWKDKIAQLRKEEALVDCWADKMKPQKVVGDESYE